MSDSSTVSQLRNELAQLTSLKHATDVYYKQVREELHMALQENTRLERVNLDLEIKQYDIQILNHMINNYPALQDSWSDFLIMLKLIDSQFADQLATRVKESQR